ncbi:MAG: hypothetical protein RKP73_17955, partial [Candidatus Contendobacter sp.]|nr:hypothetical protein [Candidatus Contendobacter sp.]
AAITTSFFIFGRLLYDDDIRFRRPAAGANREMARTDGRASLGHGGTRACCGWFHRVKAAVLYISFGL